MAEKKAEAPKTDRKGFVAIKGKGGTTARILPSALPVWEKRGWSVDDKGTEEGTRPNTVPLPDDNDNGSQEG